MAVLPNTTNFHASIDTLLAPSVVASVFQSSGWAVRKCSWTDYEVSSEIAELVVEASNPVLVHGPVAEPLSNFIRIVEPLAAAGFSGSFECYDEDRVLILQRTFAAVGGGG